MSKELIKVELSNFSDETIQSVSARELHKFLEVKTQFIDWIKRRIDKYSFIKDIDFVALSQKRVTAQGNSIEYYDYQLSINMAKELAMVENNHKGKQARTYFINCEKALKESQRIKKARQELKLENTEMTDALRDFRMELGKDTENHHYMNEYKLINKLVLGMETTKYREHHNIPNKANLRDYLMPLQIDLILKLQKINTSFLEAGMEYPERKERLTKLYETKYKPKQLH